MFVGAGVTDGHSAIASDGRFLYIHNVAGLHKVGSGYGGTVKVCCVLLGRLSYRGTSVFGKHNGVVKIMSDETWV